MTQMHWQVVNRTYPGDGVVMGPHTVTEFEFGNGITVHYDPEVGGLYVHLPVREAIQSCGRSTETLRDDAVLVNVDRINGALTQ